MLTRVTFDHDLESEEELIHHLAFVIYEDNQACREALQLNVAMIGELNHDKVT